MTDSTRTASVRLPVAAAENGRPKDIPPKPQRPRLIVEFIPTELKDRRQWVVWRYDLRENKSGKPYYTKTPFQSRRPDTKAATDKPRTWGAFREAVDALESDDTLDGIGYVFAPDDPYFGSDLDNVLRDGEVMGWAAPYVDKLSPSYGEISPSGVGIKFIARGKLPTGVNKATGKQETGSRRPGMGPDGSGALEVYDRERFFTITGNRWGDSSDIVELPDVATELYRIAKERPRPEPKARRRADVAPAAGGVHDDDEVLRAAGYSKGFDALWRGELNGFASQSEADLALMGRLAFYCGPGQDDQVKRLFLRSGLGDRDKARRADYLERTAAKAYERGPHEYFGWTPLRNGAGGNGNGNGKHDLGGGDDDARLAKLARTDIGNGERLVARSGRDLRYCHPWNKWLVWDGRRWKVDDTAAPQRMAKKAIRAILREAATIGDLDEVKQHTKWWRESEGSSRLNAMLARAAAEDGIPILPDHLGADRYLFNVENGTIDLRTGELRPHRREDHITCLAPVRFDAAAKCPLWDKVLEKVFAGDREMIGFVQRLLGMSLTGDVSEQILPILWGAGANGKSTILGAILELMGQDYAMMAPPGLLVMKRGDSHPTERAALFGKRLVVDMESAEGSRLNEAWVKQLTGTDMISARRMREDFWDFPPTHKIMMGTNHKPEIRETKHAIWRRVKLLPFTVTIPDAEQDKKLPQKLRAEYPGILASCVRGCLDWRKDGLRPPDAVVEATNLYRAEQDVLAEFFAAECILGEQCRAKATPLYDRYRQWAGVDSMTQRAFGLAMKERGFEKKENHGMWYLRIGLRTTDGDDSAKPD